MACLALLRVGAPFFKFILQATFFSLIFLKQSGRQPRFNRLVSAPSREADSRSLASRRNQRCPRQEWCHQRRRRSRSWRHFHPEFRACMGLHGAAQCHPNSQAITYATLRQHQPRPLAGPQLRYYFQLVCRKISATTVPSVTKGANTIPLGAVDGTNPTTTRRISATHHDDDDNDNRHICLPRTPPRKRKDTPAHPVMLDTPAPSPNPQCWSH